MVNRICRQQRRQLAAFAHQCIDKKLNKSTHPVEVPAKGREGGNGDNERAYPRDQTCAIAEIPLVLKSEGLVSVHFGRVRSPKDVVQDAVHQDEDERLNAHPPAEMRTSMAL
jgi:hypothetical protein